MYYKKLETNTSLIHHKVYEEESVTSLPSLLSLKRTSRIPLPPAKFLVPDTKLMINKPSLKAVENLATFEMVNQFTKKVDISETRCTSCPYSMLKTKMEWR